MPAIESRAEPLFVVRAESPHARVFTDAIIVGVLTTAAKLAGAAKVMATARYFGTGDALDAFLIAFLLPSFVSDVVAGSFTPTLVPVLVRAQAAEGPVAAQRLARLALGFSTSLMLAAAVALALCGRWLLALAGSSFSAEKLHLSLMLFLSLVIWLPMSACIATWRAVLNAHRRFALAAIAPLASPVMLIALLFAFADRWGVAILCGGTVIGVALECLVLAFAVRSLGYPVMPLRGAWKAPELKTLRDQYFPLAAGVVVSSLGIVVDQSVAGRLGPGQVSALSYGIKLTGVLLAIVATGLSTAVLPMFSRLAAAQDWARLRHAALLYAGSATLFMVPITAALVAYSGPLVRILYQHGAFQESAAAVVTQVQRMSLLQAPLTILVSVVGRLTVSLSASVVLLRMGIAGLITNVVLDVILSRTMGVAGIALATAGVQVVSLIVLTILLRQRAPGLFGGRGA
ncbi:MAG TPA: lipid II flippase MurJ [Bryobacteraceae bacterium]|jgi:putative peptidoglycan lipid II flippase